MPQIFVTADTHFGHNKIALARGFNSVEEHDQALIDRWNSIVRKKDSVWHLGDVAFSSSKLALLARLNGTKFLVAGNHDQYPTLKYLEHFNRVVGCKELNGFVASHIPVADTQFHRYKGNIHGHMHDRSMSDDRYYCVSVEQHDLAPVSLEQVLQGFRNRGISV